MPNTLRIKRRAAGAGQAGAPSGLANAELAYNEQTNILYYGWGTGGSGGTATQAIPIAGSGSYAFNDGSNTNGTWPISINGNSATVTNGVYTNRTLTAGSGLVGGGDLSSNRTFDIGQGDGISVAADSIAVNSTVVRTTGDQTIFGSKSFAGQTNDSAANYSFDIKDGGSFYIANSIINSHLELRSDVDTIGVANRTILHANPPDTGVWNVYLPYGSGTISRLEDITATNLIGTLGVNKGGTGRTSYSNGQLLIGSGTSLAANTLTPGTGISITNGSGTITINNSITGSTSIVLSGSEYQRAALTGDVTASQNNNTTTIANDAVTNAKAANMAVNTIKGRITAGTGDPEDLTAANVRTILNVADGANNYVHPTDGGAGNTITAANLRVLSAITVNTLGHVTSVSSKDLTASDIPDHSTDKLTSGTLGVGRGGTGATTLTANNILVGNGTNAISAPYSVETTLAGGTTAIPRADAVKAYVDNLLGANDAMVFKGTIGTGGTVTALPTTHQAGWTYRVITAGTYAGKACEIGDLIIAIIDRSGSSNTNDDWTVVQTNIDGAVVGPASSTNNALAVFNGTTGKLIKNSSFIPTTVGSGLINLTDPGAIRFLRINANNTVSTLSDTDFRTAIGAGTSSTAGTVTSVAALTLGTTGTDLSSTVTNGTTTPTITLNVPTASASNRGALSSTDWTTFNNKVGTTRSITIAGTANQITSSAAGQDLSADRTWTLSLPQNIHTGATPTFGGLTINGNISGQAAALGTAATHIAVFSADPAGTTRAVGSRTAAQLLSDIGAAATNQTMFIGTTSVAINRSSASLSLAGVSIDGNAGTVTSGVYTSGSYADPSWITSLAKSKVGLGNVENTALSTWVGSTNITTLGTIATGTWNATTIAVNRGGTGQTSYINGELLIGNSTGNTLTKATLTQGTGIAITNGAGSITVAHSDTSSLSAGTVGTNGISSITVDDFGHIQSVSTATYLTQATLCSAFDAANCTIDGGTF